LPVNTIQSLGRNMGFAKGNGKYPVDFKHEVCQYYETHTGDETLAKFGVTIASLCQWRKDLGYRNKHRGYNLYTEALQPTVTKRERRNFTMTRSENGQLKAELQQRDERINSLEARLTQLEGASTIISQLKQLLN
jgi:predicted RNase H-like nuclease (RuvC/YqgF family)